MPFSGGKFISNCLALSKHVLSSNQELAQRDLLFTIHDSSYYDFKLQTALDSLPKGPTWTEYSGPGEWWHNVENHDRYICHYVHTDQYDQYKKEYANLTVVKLTNYDKFSTLGYALKKGIFPKDSKSLAEFQMGFAHWYEYSGPGDFELPVDYIMYYPDNFLVTMRKLYSFLNLDDFDGDRLYCYYTQYKKWHGLA